MIAELKRPSPAALLAKLKTGDKPTLRVYIGAAPGVGKTWQMLEDAHLLNRERVDIVIAVLETHGRFETAALAEGIERVPLRKIDYRGVTLEEMDIDAVIARDPQVAIVDELAHTEGRQFGFLGEPRVNVLELNLDLDNQNPIKR